MDKIPQQRVVETENDDVAARMVRLTWKVLGNFLLVILLLLIIVGSHESRAVLDVVFWIAVAGLIVTRYVDISVYHGHTEENEPETMRDLARYAIKLIAAAGLFWVLAHAIVTRVH